jgi:hypothetical protein
MTSYQGDGMTVSASAQILTVKPTTGGHAAITVEPMPPSVRSDGTIVPLTTDSTDVTFTLTPNVSTSYNFTNGKQICVYKLPGPPCVIPGIFPNNLWKYKNIDAQSFVMTVPPLAMGSGYEYVLFLTETKSGKTITIDPPIRCCAYIQKPTFDRFADFLGVSHDALATILIVGSVVVGLVVARLLQAKAPR